MFQKEKIKKMGSYTDLRVQILGPKFVTGESFGHLYGSPEHQTVFFFLFVLFRFLFLFGRLALFIGLPWWVH